MRFFIRTKRVWCEYMFVSLLLILQTYLKQNPNFNNKLTWDYIKISILKEMILLIWTLTVAQ